MKRLTHEETKHALRAKNSIDWKMKYEILETQFADELNKRSKSLEAQCKAGERANQKIKRLEKELRLKNEALEVIKEKTRCESDNLSITIFNIAYDTMEGKS